MPTTTRADAWPPDRLDRLARALLPVVFDARVVRLPQPQPQHPPGRGPQSATLRNETGRGQLNRQRLEQ